MLSLLWTTLVVCPGNVQKAKLFTVHSCLQIRDRMHQGPEMSLQIPAISNVALRCAVKGSAMFAPALVVLGG